MFVCGLKLFNSERSECRDCDFMNGNIRFLNYIFLTRSHMMMLKFSHLEVTVALLMCCLKALDGNIGNILDILNNCKSTVGARTVVRLLGMCC